MNQQESLLDDLVTLMTLVYVSCEFDGGRRCEAKFIVDAAHWYEGELRIRVTPKDAERLTPGDVYSAHIRRL